MGTITTTTNPQATLAGNQRKSDRTQNGVLHTVFSSGFLAIGTASSADGGATWTSNGAAVSPSGSNTYTQNGSLFIDLDDYAHLVYKDPVDGYIKYVRGTPNAARTAYTWSTAFPLQTGSGQEVHDYPDVVAHRDPANSGAWVVHTVYSLSGNYVFKARYNRLTIAANGAITRAVENTDVAAALGTANSNPGYPSIDFNHTGDGKTVAGGTPHLYVGWSAGATGAGYGIRFRKATYSAGSWTWGTEREIDNTVTITAAGCGVCLFDGTRVILAGCWNTNPAYKFAIYERDAADTTTTTRLSLITGTDGTDYLLYGSAGYDGQGNVFIFGNEFNSTAGSRASGYRRWNRSTTTFEPRVTFDPTTAVPYVSVRRGPQGQAIDYVYTDGTASPYTVSSGRIVLNQNPTAPTPQTPADNATWDSSTDQTVTLPYADPDGNAASKARLCYRPKGTTVAYAVLERDTTAASGSTIPVTVPANTWPGEVSYYGQVADNSGAWSDPGPTRTVTGIPAALAAATGGAGGTDAETGDLVNRVDNDRIMRALNLA